MKDLPDYYKLLHLDPEAPLFLIRTAYKTIMQKMKAHPDLGGDENHAKLINEAYEILSDADKREEYDKLYFDQKKSEASIHEILKKASRKNNNVSADAPQQACFFCLHPYTHTITENDTCTQCESPLMPVARDTSIDTHRRITRTPKNDPIEIQTSINSESIEGKILDLSPKGLQLALNKDLYRGQIIKIINQKFIAVAEITHQKKQKQLTKKIYGAKFLTLQFVDKQGSFVSLSI